MISNHFEAILIIYENHLNIIRKKNMVLLESPIEGGGLIQIDVHTFGIGGLTTNWLNDSKEDLFRFQSGFGSEIWYSQHCVQIPGEMNPEGSGLGQSKTAPIFLRHVLRPNGDFMEWPGGSIQIKQWNQGRFFRSSSKSQPPSSTPKRTMT